MTKKELTSNKILDAAITEFATKTYEASNTNEIARNAGVSKGTVFLHFKSKGELYLKCIDKMLNESYKESKKMDFNNISDFFERIKAISEWKMKYSKEHYQNSVLLYKSYFFCPKELTEKLNDIYIKYSKETKYAFLNFNIENYGFKPQYTKEKVMRFINMLNRGFELSFRLNSDKNFNQNDIEILYNDWTEIIDVLIKGMKQ